jgi:hypothetical protein
MNRKTVIRFVLAAVFATFASIGLLADWPFTSIFWFVSWLLLMGRSELTKKVPNKDLWIGFGVLVLFIGVAVAIEVLHLPEPGTPARCVFATVFWSLSMLAIYRCWNKWRVEA